MSRLVEVTLESLVVEDVFCNKVEAKLLCSIEGTQRVIGTVLTSQELVDFAFRVGTTIKVEEFIIYKLPKDVAHFEDISKKPETPRPLLTPAPTAQINSDSKQSE